MSNKVLEHNTEDVYLYVGNNRDQHRPDLHSVTYLDDNGAAHTIHVPADLGIDDPHEIIAAVDRASEAQLQYIRSCERDHGQLTDVDRLKANGVFEETLKPSTQSQEGGGY